MHQKLRYVLYRLLKHILFNYTFSFSKTGLQNYLMKKLGNQLKCL